MRVVITGIGGYSCIGSNVDEITASLRAGKSGIGLDHERRAFGYRSCLTGIIQEPDLKAQIKRRDRVGLSEEAKYAYVATVEAMAMAGIDVDFFEQNRAGIIYGNDSSAKAVTEAVDIIRAKKDTMMVGSGSIFQSMNSTVTMNLATILKLTGINYTISAACASGSHAVGMGFHLIKSGLEEMIICGGAQEVNPYAFGSFDGLGVFSMKEDAPAKSSRPFDRDRDGLVTSGGGATLILETLESAQRRGANILAEVVGYGFSSNGNHISNPSTESQIISINRALEMAELKASQVDYVNAHATSTPKGDEFEAKAIYEIFGSKTPVSSTKSMTGHECWMAGASELVYSILMMQQGFIAPNINFENPDQFSQNLNIIAESLETELTTVLSNSFGFGGTNSSIILKKYE
ncbi:MAG: beta-ketoacyl-[acyl-carrier-protein] synthase family protein [Reichenbachiella sp.]|uniref:beta-ketoacyl-[acyl-carrier-protein] synthase family protein n=1 Tax=Reichenbachiella sp. TaxID=2184521 RepID=UPI00326754EA